MDSEIDSEKDWLLKVPDKLKKKLDDLAEKNNISGRAPWAVIARQSLAEAVAEGSA